MSDPAKKALSERDICTKFITPALVAGGKWDVMTQIREEVSFTKGRVLVRGKKSSRGEAKRADYVLSYKPGTVDAAHRDPAELLAEYQTAQAAVAEVREKLRKELEEALTR
jgi:type I site-specific restriction endonuclease